MGYRMVSRSLSTFIGAAAPRLSASRRRVDVRPVAPDMPGFRLEQLSIEVETSEACPRVVLASEDRSWLVEGKGRQGPCGSALDRKKGA